MTTGSLRERALKGASWSVVERWVGKLVTSAVFVVLAKLLAPADFGLVALAMIVIALLQLLQEQGFGQAIIQRQDLEPAHVDTAFWVSMTIGAALTAGMALGAGAVAQLFGEPQLAPVLRALSVVFVLTGAKSVPLALLKRDMRFRPISVRTLVANVVSGGVGITMAFAGAGVTALVTQQIVATVVSVALLWLSVDWRPRFVVSRAHWRDLVSFSAYALGNQLLHYGSRRGDDFLIGVFLGTTALGYYVVAYRILMVMTDLFVNTVAAVALPTFSRMQADEARARRALYQVGRTVALASFPAFLGIAVLAPEITVVAFGSQWAPSAPVMRVLALVGALHSVMGANHTAIMGLGKPQWVFTVNAVTLVSNVVAFAIGLRWGIVGVAVAYALTAYLLAPVTLVMMRRLIALDIGRWLRAVGTPALLAAFMAVAVAVVCDTVLRDLSPHQRLGGGTAVGLAVYGLCVRAFAPSMLRESVGSARLVLRARGRAS